MFSGKSYDLEPFLEYFLHLCEQNHVTSSEDKYKGLIQYCTHKLAKTLQCLPSHKDRDFEMLLQELEYFYGSREATYSIVKVEIFTSESRTVRITTLGQFVCYHRKYQELVGKAKEEGRLSKWDYNRYFWEGLHESLR